jgi:putative phage-type endonuclease
MIERIKIDVVQNTPPWFDWRNNLRQASDAPTVIGANPYSTAADLWQIKQGLKTITQTAAMKHGSNLEPAARDKVSEMLKIKLEPQCWQYGAYGASLDAISADGSIKVEIKCPFSENSSIWKKAQKDDIEPYVFWQLVHQQYVRPTEKTYLFVYFENKEPKLIDATRLNYAGAHRRTPRCVG